MVYILHLPVEILGIICANFCRHCTHEPKEPDKPPEPDKPEKPRGQDESCFNGVMAYLMDKSRIKTATLYAMTQTCRALRDIAQPYLYHYPCARAPAQAQLLLRTLVDCPGLAKHIYQLSVFNLECGILESELRQMLPLRKYQGGGEELIREHMRRCCWYHNPMRDGRTVDIKFNVNTLFTTLVLPFGTNIKTIHLELDRYKRFSSCKPGLLPRLKELVVKNRDQKVDPIKVIASILIAAPALERLGGVHICVANWKGRRPPIHKGVKEVLFERSVVGPQVITALLGLFPRLEAFSYESDAVEPDAWYSNPIEASLSDFGEALLACPDLRYLSLDLDYGSSGNKKDPTDHLVQLKKLQKFRVKGLALSREPKQGAAPWMGRPSIKICDMLPASIAELEVACPHNIIFDDMLELSAVASQRFPLLRQVSIDRSEHVWEVSGWRKEACMVPGKIEELRQAFQRNGIELLTGDFGKYRSWMTRHG